MNGRFRLCVDFDFAGRGPLRLVADKGDLLGHARLESGGAWRGRGLLPKGGDAFSALGGVPVKKGQALVGWLAYEAGALVEPSVSMRHVGLLGEAALVRAHWQDKPAATLPNPFTLGKARWNLTQQQFEKRVREARSRIAQGDFYQVNLSMMSRRVLKGDAFDLYMALHQKNPGPYHAYFATPRHALVCNSPELLLAAEGEKLLSKPIAGTLPEEERRAGHEKKFVAHPKERAEHVMLVDLIRNDLGRVAEYGSVRVSPLLGVEHYTHVSHLVSSVLGTLRPGLNVFDALRAMIPGGTITGAPKVAAMKHIRRAEPHARGVYTGCFFVFEPPDRLTANLMIRTGFFVPTRSQQEGVLYAGAGAGIVADSDPTREWRECRAKLRQFEVAASGLFP